jgi:hypothetical protein
MSENDERRRVHSRIAKNPDYRIEDGLPVVPGCRTPEKSTQVDLEPEGDANGNGEGGNGN